MGAAAAFGLLSLALAWRYGAPPLALQATKPVAATAASQDPSAAPRPSGSNPSAAELEARRRQVEAIVAAKNAENAAQRKAFEDDGWSFVDAAAPDPAITTASPELIGKREAELRAQLASAPPGKEHLANVATIATRAHDATTRVAAVEAIGGMGPGDPQRALVDIMKKLPQGDAARAALVPLLRPTGTSDPVVSDMAALLDARDTQPREREQIAMTLSLVALREDGALPRHVIEAMSPDARFLLTRMTLLAQRSPTPDSPTRN